MSIPLDRFRKGNRPAEQPLSQAPFKKKPTSSLTPKPPAPKEKPKKVKVPVPNQEKKPLPPVTPDLWVSHHFRLARFANCSELRIIPAFVAAGLSTGIQPTEKAVNEGYVRKEAERPGKRQRWSWNVEKAFTILAAYNAEDEPEEPTP